MAGLRACARRHSNVAAARRRLPDVRPACLPEARWLSGTAVGKWIALTREPGLGPRELRFRRWSDPGMLDCDRVFAMCEEAGFDPARPFEPGYPTTCQQCTVHQNGRTTHLRLSRAFDREGVDEIRSFVPCNVCVPLLHDLQERNMVRSSGQRAVSMTAWAVVVLSIGTVVAGSQSADALNPAAAPALRAHGLQLGYNLDHAAALSAFERSCRRRPERCRRRTAWRPRRPGSSCCSSRERSPSTTTSDRREPTCRAHVRAPRSTAPFTTRFVRRSL